MYVLQMCLYFIFIFPFLQTTYTNTQTNRNMPTSQFTVIQQSDTI